MMRWLWHLLVPVGPFGLYLEGMAWYGGGWSPIYGELPLHLAPVSDPTQVGPNRSDPEHYDSMGRYLWWGC